MSYADAWLKWSDVIEAGAASLSARMVKCAELEKVRWVMDIGTGIGEPGISAAKALGDRGHIKAVDHDRNMIAIAKQRAEAQSVNNINFSVADIEELEFKKNSFDAVLARWSLMFMKDLDGLLAKLSNAITPGGKLVAATWASPVDVPAMSLAKICIREYFGIPQTAGDIPMAFSLSNIVATEHQFISAGFTQVRTELVPVIYEFHSPTEYIQYRIDVAGPLWDGMNEETEQVKQGAFEAIKAALEPYRASDNTYRMQNIAHCIVARN
jgi:ubiquinone/menaquinone biosynthesis C-methylase UbiE